MSAKDTRVSTLTRASMEDRATGDWIVVNQEICKWSEIDPERYVAYREMQAKRRVLDEKYKAATQQFVDYENSLIEETRKRYPGR